MDQQTNNVEANVTWRREILSSKPFNWSVDIDEAVILTGEALKRRNARAIADLFADQSGKFVCASAGHHLEAVMAAHGSGAVEYSRRHHKTVLNVDIGGGTTDIAVFHGGALLRQLC